MDLSKVDTVIISHGHIDHGGALERFLNMNATATVYVQREAFEPHYSKTLCLRIPVGIDRGLRSHRQVVLLDGDYKIDEELLLFTVDKTDRCYSPVNQVLYDKKGIDTFAYEQNLVISDKKTVLIMGCGHAGIVNILSKAEKCRPKFCIGGFHLFNPITKKSVPEDLLNEIAFELQNYTDVEFYTCHCTGEKAYEYLSRQMNNLHYMSCGDVIEI